jgi:hypothetical protein
MRILPTMSSVASSFSKISVTFHLRCQNRGLYFDLDSKTKKPLNRAVDLPLGASITIYYEAGEIMSTLQAVDSFGQLSREAKSPNVVKTKGSTSPAVDAP